MAAAHKLSRKPKLKTFHATMLVTRAEQWWVEAETAEQARAILASGEGHHSSLGECVCVELVGMLEGAD
ncbi:MAG: hypothetical protein ABSD08_15185 [Xanthobacteraceae bacterium]|jgi:hypothetical protein